MKIRKMITVSLVAILLASCAPMARFLATATITPAPTSTPITLTPTKKLNEPKLDEEIQIKFGESITLEKGKLRIKFKSLVGDSRCPQGVVCVWAGVIVAVARNLAIGAHEAKSIATREAEIIFLIFIAFFAG